MKFLPVSLEYDAIREIQEMILAGEVCLAWSYVLNLENGKNTDPRKIKEVAFWEQYAAAFVQKSDAVEKLSWQIQYTGVKEMDSLHVACAIEAGCSFFVSTDKRLLKYQDARVKICDPIECLSILHKIL
jgi:predicted nucleic acid-binding protein